MKPKEKIIDINDGFDIVAVWEKRGKKWHFLTLAHTRKAVALRNEQPDSRLVLDTKANPNLSRKKRRYQKSKSV